MLPEMREKAPNVQIEKVQNRASLLLRVNGSALRLSKEGCLALSVVWDLESFQEELRLEMISQS